MADSLLICEAAGARLPLSLPVKTSCAACGVRFDYEKIGPGRLRRFCSAECSHTRQRDPERRRVYGATYYAKHGTTRRTRHAKKCAACNADFDTYDLRTVTCGRRCGAVQRGKHAAVAGSGRLRKFATKSDKDRHYGYRRRSLTASQNAERVSAADIFERDGWRCGICQQKVDKRLKWPHRRSASLDHIVPIKEGGAHTRRNAQCTHLGCNSRKGVGPGGQLRLLG